MDGGAHGGSQAPPRAAPACPCHPDGAETNRTGSGRRFALLGRQGPDLGQARDRRPRAVRRRGRDRPLQDLARRDRGRGRAAADARLSGLALLSRRRTRRRISTRPSPASPRCRRGCAASWRRSVCSSRPCSKDLAQNIYDTPDFFDGYSRMDRSVRGLDGGPNGRLCARCCPICAGNGCSILAAALAGSPDGR